MNHLGERLAERRRERGLTVSDVYGELPVPAGFIEALEAGVVDQLPAACYAAGFLKSYCILLDIDSEKPLEELNRAMGVSRSDRIARPGATVTKKVVRRRPRLNLPGLPDLSLPVDLTSWGVVVALLLFGWITWTLVVDPGEEVNNSAANAALIDHPVHDSPPR